MAHRVYLSPGGEVKDNTADLAQAQRRRLEEVAESSGRYLGLLFYHAARRDDAALESTAGNPALKHPEDLLVATLLRGSAEPIPSEQLLAWGVTAENPWAVYTLTKYFLSAGAVGNAIQAAKQLLEHRLADTVSLNLIARYLAAAEVWKAAGSVIERSMRIAPLQKDMAHLAAAVGRCEKPGAPLYLDVLPRNPSVSFYLPAYSVEEYIATAIEGLLHQWYPLQEILIVDDATPDRSIEIAREYPVRVLTHKENRGLAAARNTAFRAATSDFLGAIDTDASPEPAYTAHALMEFENGLDALAGVGGRLLEAFRDTPADEWRSIYLRQDRGPVRYYMDTPPEDRSQWTESDEEFYDPDRYFLLGSNTLLRREAVLQVGGYQEERGNNAEDQGICELLKAGGDHFAFTPHAVAMHQRRDTPLSAVSTAWNWAFQARKDHGLYDDLAGIIGLLGDHIWRAQWKWNMDIEGGRMGCAAVDFLFFFSGMLLDQRYALRQGVLDGAHADCIRERVFRMVAEWDRQLGGDVEGRLREELVPLLESPCNAAPEIPPELEAVIEQTLLPLGAFLDSITPDAYRYLDGKWGQ